jgi:hypothetical protein
MAQSASPPPSSRQLTDANSKVIAAMQQGGDRALLDRYRADPLAVIAEFGGSVAALSADTQTELRGALAGVHLPADVTPGLLQSVQWSCILCESGLNIVIVVAGGLAAILIAAAAGPEILVGSAVVLAIAAYLGIAASVVAGIIVGVIAGVIMVTLEAIVAALCEATGACA